VTVTDSEPTPAPHTAGSGPAGTPGEESTRTRAHVRARPLSLPPVPELLRVWVVGDRPSPLKQTLPRFRARIDYALTGEWTAPPPLKKNGKPKITAGRATYLVLTVLIACPIALAIDLVDWAVFPLGRLLVTIPVVWLIAHNL
jgi:hypothetical protein